LNRARQSEMSPHRDPDFTLSRRDFATRPHARIAVGKAVPIATARLKIGDVDVSKPVAKDDKAARFTVRLTAGKAQLQTSFYDEHGQELCGAFYVSVRRLGRDH